MPNACPFRAFSHTHACAILTHCVHGVSLCVFPLLNTPLAELQTSTLPPKLPPQLLDGRSFEGVFHTANSDSASGLSIALKQAREQVKRIERNSLAEKPRKVIVLNFAEIAQLRAEDVSFNADDVSGTDSDLRTDDAISGGRGR